VDELSVSKQIKICNRTLILLLHYLAKTNRACNYRTLFFLYHITFNKLLKIDNIQHKWPVDYAIINNNNILMLLAKFVFKVCLSSWLNTSCLVRSMLTSYCFDHGQPAFFRRLPPFYRRPHNLSCVGADVKPCSINQPAFYPCSSKVSCLVSDLYLEENFATIALLLSKNFNSNFIFGENHVDKNSDVTVISCRYRPYTLSP